MASAANDVLAAKSAGLATERASDVYGVEAADDAHREDDVGVLAALEKVAEDVVGDAPEEGDDFVVGGLVQRKIPGV